MLVKSIKVYGKVMTFNIGDKVKIDQNYDKERFKHFDKTAYFYRDKVGVIEEVKDIQFTANKVTKMYRVRWEGKSKLKMIMDDMLIPANEKYKSVW